MSELPITIQKSIRRYEPIETNGLTLYPVLVKDYESFLIARPALEVMQQSFPVRLMRVPLLSALYQMDYEAAAAQKQATGLFSRALLALALSLRLCEGAEPEKRIENFQIAVEKERPQILQRLRFQDGDGEWKEILPAQYQTLRQIIAAQNGVRLESNLANPDIVKAKKDLSSANSTPLSANVDDLISSVAALSGKEEAEIEEWPILKLDRRSESYRRLLDYLICGIGEVSGATWKRGNPTPHPFFRRASDGGELLSVMDGATARNSTPVSGTQNILEQSKNL